MIFVSYTGVDEPWATWIAEELEAAGASVRVQTWDMPASCSSWPAGRSNRRGDPASAERLEKLTEDRPRPD